MPEAENVKVAVRVRPFNQREKDKNSKCIVQMSGNTTTLLHPSQPENNKTFTFDYSYWSHDGYTNKDGYFTPDPGHPNGSKFADQRRVFKDFGLGILKNAWDAYNSTLFAYGQTGSGKSWSIIGDKPNDGIVPLFCEQLFHDIDERRKAGNKEEYEVKLSMLEIYNEVVKDLLNPKSLETRQGLKIRENPNHGFYAQGLTEYPVASYQMIIQKMDEGKMNRTIRATKMNATSSRAHTIVGIYLVQRQKTGGEELCKSSVINLVDLAGSERVSKSEARGDRLKEGASINLSLLTLGACIHALAEGSKSNKVPYRNSQLTKLLSNALGGNSKTIMIAAISPADWNYDETMSTLRYADSAKRIQTVATINEDQTDKVIRELMAENTALKAQLTSGKVPSQLDVGDSSEDVEKVRQRYEEELKAAMLENDRKIADMKKSFDEKLKQAESERSPATNAALVKLEEEKKTKPHLSNLNFDPQFAGKIVHILKKGPNAVGNHKGSTSDVLLMGPSILQNHAVITVTDNDEVFLEPCDGEARILYNGEAVTRKMVLHHNDRVLFGATQLYVFCHPKEKNSSGLTYVNVDYTMAQEEIACKAGIILPTPDGNQNLENSVLQEDLLNVMPAVQEANSISAELDKMVKFEIVLLPPQLMGSESGLSEVCVKMKNLENGQEFVWHKEKFLNRLYIMKEMYANYEDDDVWDLPEEEDPFTESPDTEVLIGSVQVFLQPLAYMVEMKEQLEITDYKGNEIGLLNLEVVPCSAEGKEYTEQDDMFVDKPTELLGKNIHFIIKLLSARGLPNRYTDICCKYRLYLEIADSATKVIKESSNVKFNHARMISFQPVTKEVINYLHDNFFMVHVFGKQSPRKSAMVLSRGKNTREMLKNDHDIMVKTKNLMGGFNINGRMVDPQKQSIIVELLLMKKQQCRLQQKLDGVRKLTEKAQKMGRKSVPLVIMKDVLNACSVQSVEKALMQLEGMPDDVTGHPGSIKIDKGVPATRSLMCILL